MAQNSFHDNVERAKSLETKLAITELRSLIPRASSSDSLDLAMLYYYLGGRLARIDSFESAALVSQQAYGIFMDIGYKDYRLPRVVLNIAEYHQNMGNLAKAEKYYYKVLGIPISGIRSFYAHGNAVHMLSQLLRDRFNDSERAGDLVQNFLNHDSIHLIPPINLAGLYVELGTTYTDYSTNRYHQLALHAFDAADSIYGVVYGQDYPLYQKLVIENQRIKLEVVKDGYDAGLKLYDEVLRSEDYSLKDRLEMGIVQTLYFNYCVSQVEGRATVTAEMKCDDIRTSYLADLDKRSDLYFNTYIYSIRQKYYDGLYADAKSLLLELEGQIQRKEIMAMDAVRQIDLNFVRSLVYSIDDKVFGLRSAYEMVKKVDEYIVDDLSEISVINAKNNLSGLMDELVDLAIDIGDVHDVLFFAEKNRSYSLLKVLRNSPAKDRYDARLGQSSYRYIPDLLSQDQSIYYYHVGMDSVYLITLSHSGGDIKTLGETVKIIKLVSDTRASIDSKSSSVNAKLHELYTILLDDNTSHTQEIIIIPDEQLHYLPFEALIDADSKYLVESSAVSYAPSLELLQLWTQNHDYSVNDMYVLSPDYSVGSLESLVSTTKGANDYRFNYLPYAKEEVAILSKEFKVDLEEGQLYSKENVLTAIGQTDIFHFTGHAAVVPEDYRFSYLALEEVNDTEVSIIRSSDLETLDLSNSKMIMLNACDTGTGELIAGEGVFSMARSFFRAGASTVVNSLWQIDDKSSSEITIAFYRHLKSGMSKNRALQKAKIGYLYGANMDQERHPYYWAGLIATGDMHPLYFSDRWGVLKVVTMGMFAVLLSLIVIIRFKHIFRG